MLRKSDEIQGAQTPEDPTRDRLTGVMKKDEAEAQMARRAAETQGGTLFLCGVDGMRGINERYGLLTGDECLKRSARILSYLIRKDDILGRRSGDVFEIYMPSCRDPQQALAVCKRIHDRFRTNRGDERSKVPLSMTVVWEQKKPQDTLEEMFRRAEEELRTQREALESLPSQGGEGSGYIKDVKQVRKELVEQIQQPGAYCQDFETFKGIYRFLARGIIRSGQKACVILITVVNEAGGSPSLQEKDALMEQLGETIGATLRIGDVYARYSSSQYLVLVIDTTESQADRVVERIREQFQPCQGKNDVLVHSCYDLQPTQMGMIPDIGDELWPLE